MSFVYFDSFEKMSDSARAFGVALTAGDVSCLSEPLKIGNVNIPNRIAVQPLEGADAEDNGAPGEFTEKRYLRYASGGSGLIWVEATALDPEFKSNPRQLVLTEQTLGGFARLVEKIKETSLSQNGAAAAAVIQITHPGRGCFPGPRPASGEMNAPNGALISPASDSEIESLAERYGVAASLAERAGFDGIDIKACHNVFINELLSARERPGKYGGSYENRVRHFKEALAAARSSSGRMLLCSRINFYDGVLYPRGFGMKENGGFMPDFEEPLRLISEIHNEFGVSLINCSANSPKFDVVSQDCGDSLFSPPDNPVKAGARLHRFAAAIKAHVPGLAVAATGFSHFSQFASGVGAAMIERGAADFIGFARQALAYPDFAKDILKNGKMRESELCTGCGGCGRLMGGHKNVFCAVRGR